MNTIGSTLSQKFTRFVDSSKNPLLQFEDPTNSDTIFTRFNTLSEKSGLLTKADKTDAAQLIYEAKNKPDTSKLATKLVSHLADFRSHLVSKNQNLENHDLIKYDDNSGKDLLKKIAETCEQLKIPFHKIIILTLNRNHANSSLFGPSQIPAELERLINSFPGNELDNKLSIQPETQALLQNNHIYIKKREPAVDVETFNTGNNNTDDQLSYLQELVNSVFINTQIDNDINTICNIKNMHWAHTYITTAPQTTRETFLYATLAALAHQATNKESNQYIGNANEINNIQHTTLDDNKMSNLTLLTQKFKIIRDYLEDLNDKDTPNLKDQNGINKYIKTICTLNALIIKFEEKIQCNRIFSTSN